MKKFFFRLLCITAIVWLPLALILSELISSIPEIWNEVLLLYPMLFEAIKKGEKV